MFANIDHVAIQVNDLEESIRFFQEVFEMNIDKTAGEKPMRKVNILDAGSFQMEIIGSKHRMGLKLN